MAADNDSEGKDGTERLECDIVMAGGVTSGIIYPGAVAMIARRYRFRSIGGTSVGAIAAAVTAAAEYGRLSGQNTDAFELVEALPKTLGHEASDGHTRLFHLFTPETATAPLLALVTPLFGDGGRVRQLYRILKSTISFWQIALPSLATLLVGAGVIASLALNGSILLSPVALAMTIASSCVVWCVSTLGMLARNWLPAWRSNGYGICTGLSSPDPSADKGQAFEGLVHWMHRTVQAAAGRGIDQPLTFGDLWSLQVLGEKTPQQVGPHSVRAIELAMIASDISRNRTVQLPFLETPTPLYVETKILRDYFPDAVVRWMIDHRGEYDKRVEGRPDLIRLPRPEDLPVVFGARLSLSFPVLLSALPLMAPDFGKGKNEHGFIPLRRVWFSDGGLTSNFPVHFFDSPIPSRPTFCFNLVDFDAEAPNIGSPDGDDEEDPCGSANPPESAKPIAQPRAASRTAASRPEVTSSGDPPPNDDVWGFVSIAKGNQFTPAPFTAFDTAPGAGVLSFVMTLVNTARFWSDNQMLLAPGVRDRVVNIALREGEGGLNLDMDAKTIADLDRRGRAAGLLIAARFDPAQKVDPETGGENENMFANHRWVRFRNFMASFEDISRRFARARRASDTAATQRGESQLDDMIDGMATEKLGYGVPSGAGTYYRNVTNELEQLALRMAAETRMNPRATFDRPREYGPNQTRRPAGGAPRPVMRSRLRPLIDNDPRSESAELPEPPEAKKQSGEIGRAIPGDR
jgi:predicted acylesterase/phospholipase RssA